MIRCVALVLSLLLAGCFSDDLTADDLCSIELPECDSDGDGVLNGVDDFHRLINVIRRGR